MNWFKSGRKKVREMLVEQAAEAEQEKAAKAEKKKADKLVVPETSDEEVESESEAEENDEDPPPQEDMCAGLFKGCVSKKLVKAESFLSEIRVFTKGGAIRMAYITN